MYTQTVLIVIALSYIIGSIPTAYLIGRLNGINIFETGSGNMGSTNALRLLGARWGGLVFVIDIAKGVFAVWLGRHIAAMNNDIMSQASASVICAIAVVVGHNWSFFATLVTGSLRGGKGAATATGTWLIMMPAVVIVIPLAILAIIIITTRYVSLAVLTGMAVGMMLVAGLVLMRELEPVYLVYCLVSALVFFRHKDNIKRLLAGSERRVGEKA